MFRQSIIRLPSRIQPLRIRQLSTTSALTADKSYNSSQSATHQGKQTSEHVTNSKDELDIHSSASASGQRARESGDKHDSAATSEKSGGANQEAKKDTKAPGPVIGMEAERGGKWK